MPDDANIAAILTQLAQVDEIGLMLNELLPDGKYVLEDEREAIVTQVQRWSDRLGAEKILHAINSVGLAAPG